MVSFSLGHRVDKTLLRTLKKEYDRIFYDSITELINE